MSRQFLVVFSLFSALSVTSFCGGQLSAEDGVLERVKSDEVAVIEPVEFRELSEVTKEIRKAAALPGADSLSEKSSHLRIWVPQIYLGVDNAYNVTQMRYLSARVTILNFLETDVVINPDKMVLRGWGERYELNSRSKERDLMSIRVGRDSYTLKELQTPKELTIPAKQAVSFWAVYTDLDNSSVVGNLSLELPLAGEELLTHDLRSEQSLLLALQTERIGPADSLGVLTIHGRLNAVNAQNLADELLALKKQKVERAVVSWGGKASPTIDNLLDWLVHHAAGEVKNELYIQYPPLESFKFLALADLPPTNAEAGVDNRLEEFVYDTTEQAVLGGLSDLFELIDAKYLVREIRDGHPFSRRAALAALEVRQDQSLSESLFTLLSQLYDTADEETRPYVLLAIGRQKHPQAHTMLTKIAQMDREKEAEAAFTALVKSGQQSSIRAVLELLADNDLEVPREVQIRILAENFRREWTSFLVEALDDSSPEVRAAAMEGFVEVGHPNLSQILQRGLKDSSKDVRDTAFAALVEQSDRKSERIAVDYAVKLLEAGELSENIQLIITRTRDQRAAPLVLQLFQDKPPIRSGLISLLEEIGDQDSIRKLLEDVEDYTPGQQVAIYELAIKFDLPEQFQLAKQAMASEETEVQQIGLQILTQLASDPAADEIAKLLKSDQDEFVTRACYALGRAGTKHAEKLLKEFRTKAYQSQNENGLQSAANGLRLWMSHSPGWNAIESAYYHSNVDNYENALMYFDLAIEIDPDLGVAYSGKGNSLLKLDRFEESLAAFKTAYEIDSFDGQAITGIGIVSATQGETEEAVRLTVESADKFPKDDIYTYNTACVYGRAIEYLKREKPEESAETIQQYETQAIKSLESSIEYGFEEFDLMRTDPDLDSLRSLPEFQKLLRN